MCVCVCANTTTFSGFGGLPPHAFFVGTFVAVVADGWADAESAGKHSVCMHINIYASQTKHINSQTNDSIISP